MQANEYKRTLRNYGIGFVLSLLLTFLSYTLVVLLKLEGMAIMISIGVLAISQLIVQLVFFLHLGDEKKPRWRNISFLFMAIILAIIVVGSIWIMYHLNYNMMDMSADEKTQYMMGQKDGGF